MKAAATAAKARNVTVVVGSDEGSVKAAARELADKLAPLNAGEFGLEIIDGAADNAAMAVTRVHQTVDALQTLPFFGGRKLVWLKSANFLGDNPTGRAAGVVEALENLGALLAAGLPEDVTFLLSATETDKRRAFYKGLVKVADVQAFDKVDSTRSGWEEDAAAIVEERARARDLRLTGEARDLFTLLTGGDTRQIENELEKIDLFLGSGRREVDAETVRLMVPLSRAGVIFELGNAISRRDLARALGLIDQLLFQGESAIGILLVALLPTVRSLLLVKDLQERHGLSRGGSPFSFGQVLNRLPPDAIAHLPRKKDGTVNTFALGFASAEAHRFRLDRLRKGMDACLQANVQLVTSQLDQRLVLERAVIEVLGDS